MEEVKKTVNSIYWQLQAVFDKILNITRKRQAQKRAIQVCKKKWKEKNRQLGEPVRLEEEMFGYNDRFKDGYITQLFQGE